MLELARSNKSMTGFTLAVIAFTLVSSILSFANALQEPNLARSSIAILTVFPLVIAAPGLLSGMIHSFFPNRYTLVFLLPAFVVSLLCTLVFAVFIYAGPFAEFTGVNDLRKNHFQIHPIAIPFTFTVLSIGLYILALIWAICMFVNRPAR